MPPPSGCSSASRTTPTDRPATRCASPTTASPRASGRASTDRCSSPSTCGTPPTRPPRPGPSASGWPPPPGGRGRPRETDPSGATAVVTVVPTTAPQDAATSELVGTLRDDVLPGALKGTGAVAHVGGQTATFDDLATKVSDSLVLLVVVVVALSLVLLTLAFRSLVLPLVSAVLKLLSIGAAYGVVTLAFQTSVGASLLGVAEQPVVSFVPMLMFAILFGLSMDYNVFLLSAGARGAGRRHPGASGGAPRRRAHGEPHHDGGAIMTLVFLGFTFTSETEVRMIGLGLATAVLVDVTVVRLLLAPAVLELLGERAWWLRKCSSDGWPGSRCRRTDPSARTRVRSPVVPGVFTRVRGRGRVSGAASVASGELAAEALVPGGAHGVETAEGDVLAAGGVLGLDGVEGGDGRGVPDVGAAEVDDDLLRVAGVVELGTRSLLEAKNSSPSTA